MEKLFTYCSKDETRIDGPWEEGTKPSQGQRSDLTDIKNLIDEGESQRSIWDKHFNSMTRYYKGIQTYKGLANIETKNLKKRRKGVKVIWIHGPPGAGKSHKAYEMTKGKDIYSWNGTKWWDHYDGQGIVIIDDFRPNLDFEYYLKLFDKWDFMVEQKGSTTKLEAYKFIVTCPLPVEGTFRNVQGENLKQILRRITKQVIILAS